MANSRTIHLDPRTSRYSHVVVWDPVESPTWETPWETRREMGTPVVYSYVPREFWRIPWEVADISPYGRSHYKYRGKSQVARRNSHETFPTHGQSWLGEHDALHGTFQRISHGNRFHPCTYSGVYHVYFWVCTIMEASMHTVIPCTHNIPS